MPTLTVTKLERGVLHVFEYGMTYVALSRAVVSQGGDVIGGRHAIRPHLPNSQDFNRLKVLNFDMRQVKAHPKVAQFYSTLEGGLGS